VRTARAGVQRGLVLARHLATPGCERIAALGDDIDGLNDASITNPVTFRTMEFVNARHLPQCASCALRCLFQRLDGSRPEPAASVDGCASDHRCLAADETDIDRYVGASLNEVIQ
jgi:hypothetical protein